MEAPPATGPLAPATVSAPTPGRPVTLAQPRPDDDRLRTSVDRAHARWRRLWLHLQTITPSGVARSLLVLGAASAVIWLISSAWVALVPFQVGLALAYITLPLVNRLDRILPRVMAVSLVVLLELAAVIAFVGLLIPPLADQLTTLGSTLPSAVEIRVLVDQLRARIGTLPPETQAYLVEGVNRVVMFVRENAAVYAQQALTLLLLGSFSVLQWIGFVLGFLAVPTFLFAAMIDQPAGVRAVNRALPAAVRLDFWALARIVDRTLSTYLRGQLLRAAVFGTAVGFGLYALERLGLYQGTGYPLVFAMIAMVTYLIPTIGWLIGAVPAVALAAVQSRETAVAVLVLYLGIAVLENMIVARQVERRTIDIHPFVLMPTLVVASQYNLLLLILAAPLLVAVRDLFRYVYGRLGDPPRPAGVMPERANAISRGRRPPTRAALRARARSLGAAYPQPFDGRQPPDGARS